MEASQSGTLTQRVVWALAGTVALFVSALVILAYATFDRMEDDLVNDILATETSRLLQMIDRGEVRAGEAEFRWLGASMNAWFEDHPRAGHPLPAELQGLAEGLHEIEPGGAIWHVMVADSALGRVVVLYDATENEGRVYDFGLIVIGLGAICMVGAYGVARNVAKLAVGPMLDLTDRLATWAPGSPDLAVERSDEAGRLVEAFNRVQNEVDRIMAREREFTANLSHEVRTPLSAMRTDSEIMLLATTLNDDQKLRLHRIMANVDAVTSALAGARALAADERRPRETVDLAGVLDDAWRVQAMQAEAAGLLLDNRIAPDITRELDRHAVLTVLRNLIRNAVEHAAPATLRAEWDGQAMLVRDDGRGIDSAALPFVFDRYYSGHRTDQTNGHGVTPVSDAAPRRGLGLAIAKRICDMQGWSLSVTSHTSGPDQGTTFRLEFDLNA